MAKDLLDGCKAKIERAKEQIDNLENEISAILNNGEYYVERWHEFDKKRYVFRLHGPQLPLRISVLVGEIIHHLRSTLDYLVWAGINKNGMSRSDLKRIVFPVCSTSEKFKEMIKKGVLKGAPKILVDLVEQLQPYNTKNPETSIIQIIHDLDIMDKHQLLVITTHAVKIGQQITFTGELTSNVSIIPAKPPAPRFPFFSAIENNVEVFWLSYETTTQPKWEVSNNFSIQVEFQINSNNLEVIATLKQFYNYIEDLFSKIKVY